MGFSAGSSFSVLRPDLASMIEFDMAADRLGFVASRAMRTLNVVQQSTTFGRLKVEELIKYNADIRAGNGAYGRIDGEIENDSYACVERGLEGRVDDRTANIYANVIDSESMVLAQVLDNILRNKEREVSAALTNSSVWTGSDYTTAVGTAWSTAATATPIADVEAAKLKVWAKTGLYPNAIILSRKDYAYLRACTSVINRIESSGAGFPTAAGRITTQQIAEVLELDYVLVSGGAKDNANMGQSRSITSIWPTGKAQVCRIAETDDMAEPCIGRTFHWVGDGSNENGTVEMYREEQTRSNIIRVRHDVHYKVLYYQLGHVLTGLSS